MPREVRNPDHPSPSASSWLGDAPPVPGPGYALQPVGETAVGLGVVAATGPPLSSVTDNLRRARLRAAAGFLAVSLLGLLAWRLLSATEPRSLVVLHSAVVCGLGAAVVLLGSRVRLSARFVRVLEVVVFGLTALYLAAREYQSMLDAAEPGGALLLVSSLKTTLIGTMILTFSYGMLIPNTWQRAACVVAAITAVPVATALYAFVQHSYALYPAFLTTERVSESLVLMLLAAGLSIYGTHVINSLRTEAFEARQLNQYRLGRRLGTGGMGEVYLAEHQFLKRPCALKLVRPEAAGDPVTLSRFEREVRATARLSHPNTVEIYDYGHDKDGTFFYVMEYLPGLSLDELVKRHGPMPPGRVIYLLRQVCGALAEAHAANLIHRDVKPANVFACYRGGRHDVAKLLDFGLVKAALETGPERDPEVSRQGIVRGTPLYMAPEQVTGHRLDHRCDLYAIGAVAYTLLTGSPPFPGDDRTTVLAAQVRDPVRPPRTARPDLPEDLEAVVLRCLAKSPSGRYPDADQLSDALAACASADDWDAAKAEAWWRENEPKACRPITS